MTQSKKLEMWGTATGWRKSHLNDPDNRVDVTATISGRALKLHLWKGQTSMKLSMVDIKNLYEFLKEHFESLPPPQERVRTSSLSYLAKHASLNMVEVSEDRFWKKDALAAAALEDDRVYFIDENEEGIWLYSEDGRHTLAYRFV